MRSSLICRDHGRLLGALLENGWDASAELRPVDTVLPPEAISAFVAGQFKRRLALGCFTRRCLRELDLDGGLIDYRCGDEKYDQKDQYHVHKGRDVDARNDIVILIAGKSTCHLSGQLSYNETFQCFGFGQ